MRPELEIMEKIEQYLTGRLTATEKVAFEQQVAMDPALGEQVRIQQQVMRGIERVALKEKVYTARMRFYRARNFMRWGLGSFGTVAVLTVALFIYQGSGKKGYVLPELNEKGEKQWVDADRNVAAQVFTIDGAKDTVIETQAGIVMAIPSHTFVNSEGQPVDGSIDLVMKEALDPASIVKGGLSTRSGDQLLESGGMFYLDARKKNQILKIDAGKSISAEIPTKEVKDGMLLFTGKRTANGKIDWIDPTPLEHDLVSVDMKMLNFYPPGYLDSVNNWGYDIANREFTDSLYYSFASLFSETAKDSTKALANVESDAAYYPQVDSIRRIKADTSGRQPSTPLSGRMLFMTKCESCHKVLGESTGPHLGGVLNNDYYKGDVRKMLRWMYNTTSLVNSDPHYTNLKWSFGSVMQQFDPATLSEKDLRSILNYIEDVDQSGREDIYYNPCGINPAKIQAIRGNEFQNTILSTREFEERLQVIHYFKDPALLDLYVNNVDKPLWYIDSLAARICPASDRPNPFRAFAGRHDGRIKSGNVQAEMLRKYYANKTRALTEAISKTQREFWSRQGKLDNEANMKKEQHVADSSNRRDENLYKEFDINLRSAYRQLGYGDVIPMSTGGPAYQVNITSTGWCNVDRYVFEATLTRTTLNYTDTQTGKQAIIRYRPATFQINEWNDFDRLYVYLLPDSLNSFMQIDGANGIYSEELNQLMKYDLVCIGYKGKVAWYYSENNIQASNYGNLELRAMTEEKLDSNLNELKNSGQRQDLKNEAQYFRFAINDFQRQRQNVAIRELEIKMRTFLFQCTGTAYAFKP